VTGCPLAALLAALAGTAAAGTSSDLPIPLPPPLVVEAPPPAVEPPPGDALELLWGHRIDFSGGAPLITIRLLEDRDELVVGTRGPTRLEPRDAPPSRLAGGMRFRIRVRGGVPAAVSWRPLLGQFEARDRAGIDRARAAWEARGVPTRTRPTGGVYGVAGHVIDNRRTLVLADGTFTESSAAAFAADAWRRFGERPEPTAEVLARPSGFVEVLGSKGEILATGDRLVVLDGRSEGFTLEDRSYRGRLHLTVDAGGRLAAVLALPLEELLRGLVPSEMPAGSPPEALRAQAVTARSNVLAQIGTRHLADPWSLCSDVHCQAYRGEGAQVASTDAAVRDTSGEALFAVADGRLVDGVYSAMCGGHGENNDAVWGGTPSPSLRGRPDLVAADASAWAGGLASEGRVSAFLAGAPLAWCARAPGSKADRYRWERRIAPEKLDIMLATLGVGAVDDLVVVERGASGRALALRVDGDRGSATVHGELRIRRLLGDLPSAMFVIAPEREGWAFRGGGWGHGVGMCQWGAIARAGAGQGYRQILGAYFAGAAVARIY
jgi:stage II sporulation protein D